jgi:hypothetical protein
VERGVEKSSGLTDAWLLSQSSTCGKENLASSGEIIMCVCSASALGLQFNSWVLTGCGTHGKLDSCGSVREEKRAGLEVCG